MSTDALPVVYNLKGNTTTSNAIWGDNIRRCIIQMCWESRHYKHYITVNNENNVEKSRMPQESNPTGGGLTTNETNDWITEDEVINRNLNINNLLALDKTNFEPLQFLHFT